MLNKGPSFCPVPSDINGYKLVVDSEKFEIKLRYALYSHKVVLESQFFKETQTTFPTSKKNHGKKAPMSNSLQLDAFLEEVKSKLFNSANVRKIPDNLSKREREALRSLKKLKDQVIRIQDKRSRIVVLDKSEYDSKMRQQLLNPMHYKDLENNPVSDHVALISERSNKWQDRN